MAAKNTQMLASACSLQARPAPELDAVDQGNFAVHSVLRLRRLALVWPRGVFARRLGRALTSPESAAETVNVVRVR